MDTIILSPGWFLKFGVITELIFAIITLLLAFMAFKAYKLTGTRVTKLFTYAFGFMSLSYVAFASIHFFVLTGFNAIITSYLKFLPLNLFNLFGVYAHFFFMLAGLSVLVYMTFRVPKSEIFFTLLFSSIFAVFMSRNVFVVFFTVSIIYLLVILTYYVKLFSKKWTPANLRMSLAFLFLLMGNIFYFISLNNASLFVEAELLILFGYLIILYNLFSVLRK